MYLSNSFEKYCFLEVKIDSVTGLRVTLIQGLFCSDC